VRGLRFATILAGVAASVLVAGCGNRIELELSSPFTNPHLREEIEREVRRAEGPIRRRVSIRETAPQEGTTPEAPLTINGIPARPEMPRRRAIEECIEWVVERDEDVLFAVYPEGDDARREEAELFRGAGAIIIAIPAPENYSRSTDTLVEAGAGGAATVVLLLGENAPQIAHWLGGRSEEPVIVTEALFADSVENLREAGVRIAGAIVLDLAGTLATVDNYRNGSVSEIYLSSDFYR